VLHLFHFVHLCGSVVCAWSNDESKHLAIQRGTVSNGQACRMVSHRFFLQFKHPHQQTAVSHNSRIQPEGTDEERDDVENVHQNPYALALNGGGDKIFTSMLTTDAHTKDVDADVVAIQVGRRRHYLRSMIVRTMSEQS
jgi:hypothetical protein